MSTEKKPRRMKMTAAGEIQEDEKGTRHLLAYLPKDVWENGVKGSRWYASYGDDIVEMDAQSWVKLEFALRSAEDSLVQYILDTPISIRNTSTS